MTIQEKLNKIEKQNAEIQKQNKQILFLLNLFISSSEFAVTDCAYSEDDERKKYGFLTPGRRNFEEGPMDKKTFASILKDYARDGGIPQEILDEVVKTI